MNKYIYLLIFFGLNVNCALKAQNVKHEAEDAQLVGVTVENQLAGYSGTGYVSNFDQDGDKVIFRFNNEAKGKFELYIGYAAPNGNKNNYVFVNGNNIGNILFENSNQFKEVDVGKIFLEEGDNSITIEKSWGWFYLDYIRIDNTSNETSWDISKEPINQNATQEAISLKAFLTNNFGKTTFAGQFLAEEKKYTDANSEITYIYNKTGKYPALYGNDLIDYSPTRIQYGSSSKAIEDIISWHKNEGGMITLTWHWNAPTDLYNTNDNPWWSGFYTRATYFDIAAVLANPNGEKYKLLIRDIDAIAVQLKRLQNEKIPILWRPLHEAEGAWFWWGAKGPQACVELWRLLYDRLTNYHQINNLLWVWTTSDSPEALDWYPGDEYVDILGVDVYLNDGDYGVSSTLFDNLRTMFNGKKLLTMSENGTIPDPDKLFEYDAYWLYFCTWVGDFILNNQTNTSEHLNTVFNHENITTLDELPNNWLDAVGKVEFNNLVEPSHPFLEKMTSPFTNQLTLSFKNKLPNTIHLIDILGHELLTINEKQIANSMSISMQQYPTGVYFISLIGPSSFETHKIIKQ